MKIVEVYTPLVGLVLLGLIVQRLLPAIAATYLGQFLFWIGIPISTVAFLRQADLSGQIWIAPLIAWLAILLGAGLAWTWINLKGFRGKATINDSFWSKPTQGSFILTAMVGNTGYLGYPVTLAFVGTQYFALALFYDLLGTALAAYGLGVAIAAYYGGGVQSYIQLAQAIIINPTLWSFGFGLVFRKLPVSQPIEIILQGLGWTVVALSLILFGMRLSQLNSWHSLPKALISLAIKMLLVPLILGSSLSLFGITGATRLVIVLQMSMPPAFATLVLAEAYNLDRDLAVTALAVGSAGLLLILPIWLLIFGY